MNYLVQKSFDFAKLRHKDQKYDSHDFMFHIYSVFNTATEYTNDEHVLAAAILHDTIEDTETTYQDIFDGFGEHTADIVYYVTDPQGNNRRERKERLYFNYQTLLADEKVLEILKSDVALVKCCDRYSNMSYSYANSDYHKMKMYIKEYPEFRLNFVSVASSLYYTLNARLDNLIDIMNDKVESEL